MDLSKLEISDELREQILSMHQEEVSGLIAKRDELLTETKEAKSQAQAKAEALKKAEEERLKLAGDMDGLKALYEKTNAETLALAQAKADALVSRDKSEIMNTILGAVEAPFKEFVKKALDSDIKVSHNEQGQPIYEIKAGDKTFDNHADFLSWAKEQDAWKNVLTGAKTSGAGAVQSSNGGAIKDTVQSRLANRLRAQGLQI